MSCLCSPCISSLSMVSAWSGSSAELVQVLALPYVTAEALGKCPHSSEAQCPLYKVRSAAPPPSNWGESKKRECT